MLIEFKKGLKTWLTKNFRKREFDCNCKVDHETIIDDELVEKVQTIREHFGKPGNLNSAHRCEWYNKNMKPRGAKNSHHIKGEAVDLVIDGVDPRLVAAYAASLGLRVGFYKTFTHIDVSDRDHFIGKY